MTKRSLRTVPATLLMTTAMTWGIAHAAGTVGPAEPVRTPAQAATGSPATGSMVVVPPAPAQPAPALGGDTGAGGGKAASGLPADLQPAMPGEPASAASAATRPAPGVNPVSRVPAPKTGKP